MSKFGWDYPPGAANDPMAPYNQTDDGWENELEEMRDALKEHDTGRWEWEKIDCCLTGKDADLEPWGQQGIELVECDEERVYCVAHILSTVAGLEVTLNLTPEIEEDDEAYDKAKEAYLEQAGLVVQGCGVRGEWDGEDWELSEGVKFAVEWIFQENPQTGEPDYAKTAEAVIAKATEVLEPIEKELVYMDRLLNELSGWTESTENPDDEPVRCEEGKPGKYAAWLQ